MVLDTQQKPGRQTLTDGQHWLLALCLRYQLSSLTEPLLRSYQKRIRYQLLSKTCQWKTKKERLQAIQVEFNQDGPCSKIHMTKKKNV